MATMKLTIENLNNIKKAEIDFSRKLSVVSGINVDVMRGLSLLVELIMKLDKYSKEEFCEARWLHGPYISPNEGHEEGQITLTVGEDVVLGASVTKDGVSNVKVNPKKLDYGKKSDHHAFTLEFPEDGLHPVTQVEFADRIVQIAKKEEFVFVLSNSPYLLEGLKRYSDRAGNVPTKFDLLEEEKDGNFVLKQDCLSDIFESFSRPFEEFRRMDAEDLSD